MAKRTDELTLGGILRYNTAPVPRLGGITAPIWLLQLGLEEDVVVDIYDQLFDWMTQPTTTRMQTVRLDNLDAPEMSLEATGVIRLYVKGRGDVAFDVPDRATMTDSDRWLIDDQSWTHVFHTPLLVYSHVLISLRNVDVALPRERVTLWDEEDDHGR